jgi:hypothetical protein
MTTITLSKKLREVTDIPSYPSQLPQTSIPLTKLHQLYQYTTYIEVETNSIPLYIPLQYIREETVVIESYSHKKNDPEHIIWCNVLDGDVRTIQFTKGYFALLMERKQVYIDPQSVRKEIITW